VSAILFLLPSLTSGAGGGIERAARELVEATARVRPEARLGVVLAREPRLLDPGALDGALARRLEVSGVASERRALRIAELGVRAAALTARLRPSLVWCAHVNHAPLGHALAALSRAKLAVQAHGIEAWSVRAPSVRHALRRAERVVAVSTVTAERLAQAAALPVGRIALLPNAVDTARFTPGDARADVEHRLADLPRPRLLTVARLDATEGYKGVDVVLRALAGPARPLGASYVVVGEGSDRPRLEVLAAGLGVAARFLGRADERDLVDLYRACDVFVMPSRGEGFGIVFAEAAACGRPLVAGNADGSVDALGGGALGLLCDPSSVDEVAAAIAAHVRGTSPAALRDPERLHREVDARFGRAAFRRRLAALLDELE
jgi:glycosyltransferase involved in cell wall biosynthesis